MGDNMIIIGFIAIVIILILSIVIFVKDRKNDKCECKGCNLCTRKYQQTKHKQ